MRWEIQFSKTSYVKATDKNVFPQFEFWFTEVLLKQLINKLVKNIWNSIECSK